LLNGAGYAKWLAYALLPQSRMVNTSAGFADRYIEIENATMHSHGDGEAHAHGATAFTTWLDLRLAVEQASVIDQTLELEASGFEDLKSDLLSLDDALEAAFAALSDQPLIGSHPVYQYLSERYGLNLKSLHWEPDAMPDAAMWRELETLRKNHPGTILLWEGEPLPEIKDRLSALGIRSVVFDPCGNRPESGDFLSVMQQNLRNIQSIEVK
jgi:zinc transport system substrate-binding protein